MNLFHPQLEIVEVMRQSSHVGTEPLTSEPKGFLSFVPYFPYFLQPLLRVGPPSGSLLVLLSILRVGLPFCSLLVLLSILRVGPPFDSSLVMLFVVTISGKWNRSGL